MIRCCKEQIQSGAILIYKAQLEKREFDVRLLKRLIFNHID